jgi:hypothetical protein
MDHRVLPVDVMRRVTRGVRGQLHLRKQHKERDTKILQHTCIAPTIGGACISRRHHWKGQKSTGAAKPRGRSFAVVWYLGLREYSAIIICCHFRQILT